MKTLALWFSVFFCLVGGAYLEGIAFETLWNAHLALLVFGPVAAYAFFFAGFAGVFGFAKRFFRASCDLEDLRLVRHCSAVGVFAGLIAFLLFTIHALQTTADLGALMRGLGVAVQGLFYGLLPLLFGFAAFRTSAPRLALVHLNRRKDKARA